jgi:SAM-dependent methyltransferase
MLCGHSALRVLRRVENVDLVECSRCRLTFVDPFPSPAEVSSLYTDSYFARERGVGGYVDYAAASALKLLSFRGILDRIEPRLPSAPRLLDIGAAHGLMLDLAAARGWRDAVGVEPDPTAAKLARDKGHEIICGLLPEALDHVAGQFDVISLLDVVEHFTRPLEELQRLRARLRPGGLIVLVTPDFGGVFRPIMGARWPHLKPNEHLWYFRKGTLRSLLERAGYRNIELSPFFKTTSIDYLLADFSKRTDFSGRLARGARAVMPRFAKAPLPLYLDELFAVASS